MSFKFLFTDLLIRIMKKYVADKIENDILNKVLDCAN